MDAAIFPSATIAEFYRLALLLTGDVYSAQQVLANSLTEAEARVEQLRSPERRRFWLATRLRQYSLEQSEGMEPLPTAPRLLREEPLNVEAQEVLGIEAYIVAQRFHALPEPERSALALFYLNLFNTEEISQIVGLSLEQLADVLGRARTLLQDSLRAAQTPIASREPEDC
ncbi:RNA polymerase sigma factor [Verrucomicrobiota bacterium sgz303538]